MLADPAAAKKRVAEFANAVGQAREAEAARKAAEADRIRVTAAIAAAEKRSEDKIAAELAAHTVELQSRTKVLDGREAAIVEREREADKIIAELKTERADLKRRLDAIRTAAE